MDASIRHDLVAVFRPVEGDIPGNAEDRAVSMFTKSKRGVETGDSQQDPRVFDYKSHNPKDDQIKVFEYDYHGNASETPRAAQGAADLTFRLPPLTMADIDEEYEFCDYSFSSEAPTRQSIPRDTKLPVLTKEGIAGSRLFPQGSDDRRKLVLGPGWVDHVFGPAPVSSTASNTAHLSKKTQDPHEDSKLTDQIPHLLSSDQGVDGQNTIRERLFEEKKLSFLDLGKKSGFERMERSRGKRPELESQVDQPWPKTTDPTMTNTRADQPAAEKLDLYICQHEEQDAPNVCTSAAYDGRHGKLGECSAEEITAALYSLDLEPEMLVSIPSSKSTNDHPPMGLTSGSQEAENSEFDLMTHSVFGTGSWIEEDGNDLSNLDVEGLCEIYSMGNDIGTLKGQFGDGWKSTLRNHGDSAASGSSPENNSGADSGSRRARQSRPNGGSGHQKRLSENGDGMGDDDDPDQIKKAKIDKGPEKRLICPFYVHDPQYFRPSLEHGEKYRTCATGRGFQDIARLKEHLHRVHSPEIHCIRCGAKFAEQDDLETHLRHEDGPECQNNARPVPKSMTASMKRKLSGRGKYDKGHSDEDKWQDIYRLLFPNDPRPTSGAYRQGFGQPSTPCQEKQFIVHISEHDLPRLEQRLDSQLCYILPDPNLREQVKKVVMSEFATYTKQPSTDLPETPMSLDDSNALRHVQSGESSTDSGYGSRCGNIECTGNCHWCEQLVSPPIHPAQQPFQQGGSPYFDPEDQYLNPSLLMSPESAGRLQSTENMDELLGDFPNAYMGNPYLGS